MFDARRPVGWLFLLLVALVVSAQTLPTTMIVDTVYRADGTPAGGTLLISWPEFTTAALGAVAAGNTSVTLGAGGALSVGLVSNANATPANTIYTVVYQLDDGTVKTEYWVVPTTSPTTISAVRTTLGASSSASQMATQQYVNTALAGKANDAAVVHLSGTETIVGAKQFTVAPALPTPVNPTDAANKEYVDNSTQNVGNGSYVSTAGGTMTGPLTLSGDPVGPEQAATKRYADVGVASKADLVAGLVPGGELGTGTANNTLCLHGDSTWGGCGSSSNAVSIQNVPVATTTPTDNQVMTYVASLGEYEPKAGGGVTAGMQAVKYATDFNWTQSPATDLSIAGAKTVNLASCAAGVTGTEPWYYIYISGTGAAEAALVTGGTCTGNGQAGTLQFTTLNAHAAGYTMTSASGGLQEALIAARFNATNPSGPSQSGKVIVPPGELQAYARISVRASNVTVDFSGSIVNCYMIDTCIFAGDPANSNSFLDITLLNPRGRPMVVSGQSPFIEVNAQKTRLLNVTTRIPPTGGTFSSYVQVDNDQAFLLDGLDTSLATGSSDYGVLCNASVCNPVIYAPGPFSSNAAVGWLKNLNISLQCEGNGIDWQSGNTVKISDSVIQGFAQYGVRAGVKRGGYNGFELDNVYEEVGSCTNPAGAIGEAGVIAQGATVKVEGAMLPAGSVPQFANTGSTDYRYYIVAKSATFGASNPLYAGRALTNGSGNITVTTPDIAGASTFDLLRVTYLDLNNPREQAPYGVGNYAVATSVSRASACANGVCSFTDTQAALQSYTVATPAYFPLLDYWPGNLVLAANQDSGSVLDGAKAWVQSAPSNIVAVQGTGAPAVISTECQSVDGWTPLWLSCYTSMAPGTFYDQGAFLLAVKPNQDSGLFTNLKGRLNFPTLGSGPGHIITLSDSNFQKTIATANNRPSNDANDAFIGYDQGDGNPAHVGISLGAPVSLSSYIGNVGDGTNWLERLTSGLKEVKTNVQLDNTLTVAGTAQASALLTTGAGSWAVQGSFGTLSPALAGKSAIGFGAGGQVQVSENGGAVVGVAVLDSNGDVSENANTATQLAQAPTQCNGSFATGVQANGNANCSVADVIQLAETGQPTGIPNYGIFWFDSTCHCPKVISNNGQPVQLGLLNVFNLDANTLEEYDGANPQTLNVYGTRTDASDYERMRLGYDTTDGYFLLGADALGTGTQRGLGFWLQGSLRWVIDSGFNLKPWSDNVKDVGSSTLRLKHLYTGTYIDTTAGAVATDLPNAAITGTTLNKLAKVTGSPATAIIASTSDTAGMVGIVLDGAGTSGSAQIARGGQASCVFDAATTAGDYVQISSTTAGDCHDAGASYPGIGQILGRVLSTNASAGTYAMLVAGAEIQAPGGGAVSTVFGRAGAIAAQAGDYSVGQVTGAASLASPIFTGTPTAPTQDTSDNSNAIATDAWVKAQGYGTGGGPTLGSAAQIPVMNSGATAYAPQSISGDSTLTAAGVMANTGLQGHAIPAPASGYLNWTGAAFTWNTPSGTVSPLTQGYPVTCTGSACGASPVSLDATQFSGADMCAKVGAAVTANANTTIDARAFSGNQVCSAANAHAMIASMNGGQVLLGPGLILYVPLAESAAASFSAGASLPPAGAIVRPTMVRLSGGGGSAQNSVYSTIIRACAGTNSPVAGCVAPATREYAITSTALVYSGAPDDRLYLHIVGSGFDFTGKEPIRIAGSGTLSNNGSWTICQLDTTGARTISGRTDPDCPADPTATDIYMAVPSGLVAATITTGTVGSISITGGSPLIAPLVAGTAGSPNAIYIKNPGQYPATFTPTCTNSGGSATCSVSLMAACASSCGTVHGEIPLVDDGYNTVLSPNAFFQELDHLVIDCYGVADCVPFRSLFANEGSKIHEFTFIDSPERQIDMHGFTSQNAGSISDGFFTAGPHNTCTVGTEGGFFGDVGPHGLQDITVTMSQCSAPVNAGLRIETDDYPLYVLGGHSENTLFGILYGQSGLAAGVSANSWAGAPQSNLAAADGAYQNQQQAAIKVSTNYQLMSNGAYGTTNYSFLNIKRNSTTGYTVADDLNSNYVGDQLTTEYVFDGAGSRLELLGTCSICMNWLYGLNLGNGGGNSVVATGNITIANGKVYGIGASGTADTGLSRDSAGVVDFGNGTAGNKSATIQSAVVNAGTGFQIGGTAPNGHCLTGNGTNYVDGASCGSGGAAWGAITGTLSAQTDLQNALNLKAPLASPGFTGTPTAPTQSPGDTSSDIATDAFVATSFAPLVSPSFSGTPTVPGYAKAGTLVSGNYTSATAAGTIGDSTVVAGPYAIGWMTELTGGNNGVLPSSSPNKAMMWGLTLSYPLSTSQVTYDIGSNADNSATNNYDLGLFNSSGMLLLNLNSGTLHGNSFAPATGAVTLSWAQGTKTLQPGNYYLMYYTSNTTSTPPTLVSPSATAFTFYKGEAGGSGTCGTTQGSGGFGITTLSGGALPTSITPPANSYSWSACLPAIWIH